MHLETARLVLRSSTPLELEQLGTDSSTFEHTTQLRVTTGYLEFPDALAWALRALRERPADAEWTAPLLFIHRADRALIGFGGFKGPVDTDGAVELGYGIAPAYRRQGFATEAALAMLAHARTFPAIHTVLAHTLPERNESTRVLERCGFTLAGTLTDPTDGVVWRWRADTVSPRD